MKFVLDASLTLALFFEDEATAETEKVYDQLAEGAQALCPPHWPLEVANALLMAERRKEIQVIKTSHFLDMLVQFLISVEPSSRGLGRSLLPVARAHGLTIYDAAYLDLSMRNRVPLGSLDGALRKAARSVGVAVVPESITGEST